MPLLSGSNLPSLGHSFEEWARPESVGLHPLSANAEGVVAFPSVTASSWCRAVRPNPIHPGPIPYLEE